MTAATAKKIASASIGLTIVMVAMGAFGIITNDLYKEGLFSDFYGLIAPITVAIYLTLSALILSRNPFHIIGWLFLLVGFFISAQFGVAEIAQILTGADSESVLMRTIHVLDGDLWVPSLIIPLTLVLLYFPDGQLPSRRWWPIAFVSVIGMITVYMGYILHPYPWPENGITECCNPLAVTWGDGFFTALGNINAACLVIGMVGSVAAVIRRFRRSSGIERAQMKWLVYTAGLIPIIFFLAGLTGWMETDLFGSLFVSFPTILSIPMGIAILRYRLFDIDIIIRRTLIYAVLTALLGLVFFGIVIVLQSVLETLIAEKNDPLVTVISTLAIAALFNPLRTRVQNFIDRRFFRRKYDAERILGSFAERVRDEVNVGLLGQALLETVEKTMKPEQAHLMINAIKLEES